MIIHAVSAALIVDASAKAGVAGKQFIARMLSAASFAARDECAPMEFPRPVVGFFVARLASLPARVKFGKTPYSASLSVSPVRMRSA